MKTQIILSDEHRRIIRCCIARAGYLAASSRECGFVRSTLNAWSKPGKQIGWDTWISVVTYARAQGIVGRYFDPITLEDPPLQDISAASHEAAWMLDRLPDAERRPLVDAIAAAYGRAVARSRDGGGERAGGVA